MVDATRALRRALALVACTLVVGASACSSGDDTSGAAGDADGSAGSTSRGADTAGPYATGLRTLTLIDASRTTDEVPGVSPALPDRTIQVDVVYPADGEPGPEPTAPGGLGGAAVDDSPPAEGEFPLVVFAHGFAGRGRFFLGHAESWARVGYVVALPTFPLSRNGVNILADYRNQPGDVSFVIDELSALSDDPLAGHIDVERVAVGGHSLGGVTVLGVGYNTCCLDERVDATIQVSGGPLPFEGGDFDHHPPTPMLLVHGTADETVPIAVGDALFDTIEVPMWYLRAEGATHSGVFADEPGMLFDDAVLAFLAAELRDDDAALDAMAGEVEASGIAEWRVRTAAG